jgi:peptidylprolyl isomerase domain and WD repeat-containing protein 1
MAAPSAGSKRPLADDDESSDDDVGPSLPLMTGSLGAGAGAGPAGAGGGAQADEVMTSGASGDAEAGTTGAAAGVADGDDGSGRRGGSDAAPRKRAREVPGGAASEAAYLAALPSAELYEKSYMHRDAVTHVLWTPRTDFLVTGSCDGVVKFWKKVPGGVEYAKAYRAHMGPLVALAVSCDGQRLASVGDDSTVKFFDVINFDLVDMAKTTFAPAAAVWAYARGSSKPYLAVSSRYGPEIYLLNAEKATEAPEHTLRLHASPVTAMAYCPAIDTAISIDAKGVVEYWSPNPSTGFKPPSGLVSFASKLDTDLYDLAKVKAVPTSLAISPDGAHFAVTASDRRVRLFQTRTGKLVHTYDEGRATIAAAHASGALPGIDAMDFGRREAVEEELFAATAAARTEFLAPPSATVVGPTVPSKAGSAAGAGAGAGSGAASSSSASSTATADGHTYRPPASNVIFDESGAFLIFPSLAGIKIVNTVTNRVCAVLGQLESTERFLCVALYQGVPTISSQMALARGSISMSAPVSGAGAGAGAGGSGASSASGPGGVTAGAVDPTIVCCAFKRQRFFLFTRRDPAQDEGAADARDAQNEPPSARDIAVAAATAAAQKRAKLGSSAIIHTGKGDITVSLFPDATPVAVENFCELSRKGYYDTTGFHRVIKSFMIQGGDPKGDGTGGSSVWDRDFEDEIDVRSRKFDRGGVLAMANAGPNTNGSQFFITTAPAPWLDGKHTIFGRVTKGMDVLKAIETVKVDRDDKPLEPIRILGVTINA